MLKYKMVVKRKTIRSIKAVAEDPRGDPATREVAQQKLKELAPSLRFPGYYTNKKNWKKGRGKRERYSLEFYMMKIVIENWQNVFENQPNYQWEIEGAGHDFWFDRDYNSRHTTLESVMLEIEHYMQWEGLEVRLIKRAKLLQNFEIRQAQYQLDAAKAENNGWKVEHAERLLRWAKQWEID